MEHKSGRIVIQLRLSIGRRQIGALLALTLLCIQPLPLATESLTLTTYYPSPYGVYDELRSTNDAYFAYTSGNVGIGTESPSTKLDVSGGINGTGNLTITGNGTLGGDLQAGNGKFTQGVAVGHMGSPGVGNLTTTGNIGVGTTSPTAGYALDVNGKTYSRSPIRIGTGSCTTLSFTSSGAHACASGRYATWAAGIYQEGYTYNNQHEVYDLVGWELYTGTSGSMLCCLK